jgi:hypothetical protein
MMHGSYLKFRIFPVLFIAWLVLEGCGSSSTPKTPTCLLASDCQNSLQCVQGYCVTACKQSKDCPSGERCIIATQGNTCQPTETAKCQYTSQCTVPLVCALDGECRNQCQADIDCLTGQKCTSVTHLCADPSIDKNYDPATNEFVGMADAGVADGGGTSPGRLDAAADRQPTAETGGGTGGATIDGGTGRTDGGAGNIGDGRGDTSVDAPTTFDTATALDSSALDGGGGTVAQQCLTGLVNPFAAMAPDWANWSSSSCSSLAAAAGSLVLTQNEPCSAASPNAIAGLAPPNVLCGDFDVQVDYAVTGLVAGVPGGIFASMRAHDLTVTTNGMTIERYAAEHPIPSSQSYQNYKSYTANLGDDATSVFAPTTDVTGRLRLTRAGTTVKSYYWKAGTPDGQWVLVNTATLSSTPWTLVLYEGDNSAANKGPAPYSVTFSNLLVTSPGATDAGTTDALSTDAPSTDDPSTSHLVAYYPFHGDGQDLSGNGNNAIVTKNVVFQPGEDGLAATFDGSSSYFQVAESSSLMLTGPLTIAAWVNPGREDDLNCIVDKDYGLIGYNLYLNNGGVDMRISSTAGTSSVTAGSVPLNVWSHVAGVYTGSQILIYVNGRLVGQTAAGSLSNCSKDLYIGMWGAGGRYFQGQIENVRIYSGDLSAAEVQALASSRQ